MLEIAGFVAELFSPAGWRKGWHKIALGTAFVGALILALVLVLLR